MTLEVTASSGNVFQDLGFPVEEAEHLKVRAELMSHLQEAIRRRGLKQAAGWLGPDEILEVFRARILGAS